MNVTCGTRKLDHGGKFSGCFTYFGPIECHQHGHDRLGDLRVRWPGPRERRELLFVGGLAVRAELKADARSGMKQLALDATATLLLSHPVLR